MNAPKPHTHRAIAGRLGALALAALLAPGAPAQAPAPASPPPGVAIADEPGVPPGALPAGASPALPASAAPAPGQQVAPPIVPARFSTSNMDSLEMLQDAWTDPDKHRGKGQTIPGYRRVPYDPRRTSVHEMRTGIWTRVVLDPSEEIVIATPGDESVDGWVAAPNMILVRPREAGIDTNLSIFTRAGNGYSLMIRGVNHTAKRIPDVIVNLTGPARGAPPASGHRGQRSGWTRPGARLDDAAGMEPGTWTGRGTRNASAMPAPDTDRWNEGASEVGGLDRVRTLARLSSDQRPDGAFGNLETQAFDPAELFHDLSAFASSEEAIAAIGPIRIFRSRVWTYIDFGREKAASMQSWPVALRVIDDTEAAVASTIGGHHKQMLIVKATGRLVLRSGQHVICILPKTKIEGPPPRAPVPIPVQPPAHTHIEAAQISAAHAGTGASAGTQRLRTLSAAPAGDARRARPRARGERELGHRVRARLTGTDAPTRQTTVARIIADAQMHPVNDDTDDVLDLHPQIAEAVCEAAVAAGIACTVRNHAGHDDG